MNIILTDPGVHDYEESNVDWNRVMELLQKYNTEYTYASVTNNDNKPYFKAYRNLGSNVWKCRFITLEA